MLEFRAGKMRLEGTRVVPDARKGLVRIARGEEGLMHFQWLDRTLNVLEDIQDLVGSANIMLLPEECSICIAVGKIAQIRKNFWLSVVNLTCLLCKSVLRILSGLIGFSAAGFK